MSSYKTPAGLDLDSDEARKNKALWKAKSEVFVAENLRARADPEKEELYAEIRLLRGQLNYAHGEIKRLAYQVELSKPNNQAVKAEKTKHSKTTEVMVKNDKNPKAVQTTKARQAELFEEDDVFVDRKEVSKHAQAAKGERSNLAVAKDIIELLEVVYNVDDPPRSTIEAADRLRKDIHNFTAPDSH
ncbi:hypothetical protein BC567DRAFT_268225 [Phyllosticta citribraziliensis]